MSRFEIRDKFYLDSNGFQVISGGIHYFRTVPEYWRDRLEKLKAMGCNTVETYVPWNMHEPEKGKFDFEGMLDIERFILLAQELGLWVIVRPSPYICSEWEFGGLPWWLLQEDGMKLRCNYGPYINHVRDYYEKLMSILAPLQVDRGGPIIMMQIENEYGYYGNDTSYMVELKNIMISGGVTVPLVTSDGPYDHSLTSGIVEGALPTGNFGSRTEEKFNTLKTYTNGGPLMCMEFWVGWFDHWGSENHHTTDMESSIVELNKVLGQGNVNIYMFIGGTNFGFMNGSSYYDKLAPDVTSYDYDALLTENGAITKKYEEFQKVISKYAKIPEVKLSTVIKEKAYGELKLNKKVSLFDSLNEISSPTHNLFPQSMEKLGIGYGYVLYRTVLSGYKKIENIQLLDANDRAHIYIDKKLVATLYDLELLGEVKLDIPVEEGSTIDILVENMGRVNFGTRLEKQRKGICSGVVINGHQHYQWEQYALPLNNLEALDYKDENIDGAPGFYQFEFDVEECCDTFLDFDGWGKGIALINGFNLGRFWEVGPQKRLYIPAPLLKEGKNEIILFETEGKSGDTISLEETPKLED